MSGAEIIFSSWANTLLPHRKLVAKTGEDGKFSWAAAPEESLRIQVRADGFVSTFTGVGEAIEDDPMVELALRKRD